MAELIEKHRVIVSADNTITQTTKTTQELIDMFSNEFGKNINNWDWALISEYKYLTEDFIRKFKNRVTWFLISRCQKLSENFIRKFKDEVDWDYICMYQTLSENIIINMNEKVTVANVKD